jgi:phage-related protein
MSMEEAQQAIADRVESYWDGVPQNMWEGFRSGWDYYFGADGAGIFALMGDAFSNAIGGIKNMLGIHSPSTVFEEIGKSLDDGAVKGILDNLSTVDDAMDDLGESLMPDDDILGDDIITTTTTTTDSSGDNLPELIPTGGSEPEREVVVILELDGIEVGRTLAPYVNRENARIGSRLSAEGGF